jgi:hypothetical protein
MEEQEARAREMFAQGDSVNKVATTLGITWQAARKIQGPPAEKAGKKRGRKKSSNGAVAVHLKEEEVPEAWDLALTLPTSRMDDIFAEFTAQEKADAIAAVLQARLDALITPAVGSN